MDADKQFQKDVQKAINKMRVAVDGKPLRVGMAACSTTFAALCDSLPDAETNEAIKMFGEAVLATRANVKAIQSK
jgi:hypothetical protein